ncbi:MAG TPA: hypothetical protein VNA69_15375 [Thermoanaerobaculia bacterium]|nr:hypothetical protein [Thermoanaerobaculia bacterium]
MLGDRPSAFGDMITRRYVFQHDDAGVREPKSYRELAEPAIDRDQNLARCGRNPKDLDVARITWPRQNAFGLVSVAAQLLGDAMRDAPVNQQLHW